MRGRANWAGTATAATSARRLRFRPRRSWTRCSRSSTGNEVVLYYLVAATACWWATRLGYSYGVRLDSRVHILPYGSSIGIVLVMRRLTDLLISPKRPRCPGAAQPRTFESKAARPANAPSTQ